MRSSALKRDYWVDLCKDVFSKNISLPATDVTNAHYGGLDIVGEHIYFLTAKEDPWKFAGKRVAGDGDTKNGVWHIDCY